MTTAKDEAFWSWAIVETLRHTGTRHEELLELTHLALITHTLPVHIAAKLLGHADLGATQTG